MFFLQAQDINSLENFDLRTSELIFQGKRLIRSLSLSKQLRQKAIDICREELDGGKLCIIIESEIDLTLWTQKNDSEATETNFELPPSSPSQVAPPHPPENPPKIILNADFIELCRQKLNECVISPIAERLLQKTLKNYPKMPPEQLVNILAAQIPDTQQAEKFRQSILSSR